MSLAPFALGFARAADAHYGYDITPVIFASQKRTGQSNASASDGHLRQRHNVESAHVVNSRQVL